MEREILFRGKRKDNGEWVYGYYTHQHSLPQIYLLPENISIFESYHVHPETVGQFTGLFDKNGDRIFEGKESVYVVMGGEIGVLVDVLMHDGQWCVYRKEQGYAPLFNMPQLNSCEIEVNNNIHEGGKK